MLPVNVIPSELLHQILRLAIRGQVEIQSSSQPDKKITRVDILLCCRRWHDVGKPVLYEDIVVSFKNAKAFIPSLDSMPRV